MSDVRASPEVSDSDDDLDAEHVTVLHTAQSAATAQAMMVGLTPYSAGPSGGGNAGAGAGDSNDDGDHSNDDTAPWGTGPARTSDKPRKRKGFRVKLTVICGSSQVVIPDLSLGKAAQTGRWLAGVGIQRASRTPHMSRHLPGFRRGSKFGMRNGFYAPVSMKTEEGEDVRPGAKLADLFSADAEGGKKVKKRSIVLILAPKRTAPRFLGQDKPPPQTTWAAEAFNFSKKGVEMAKKLQARDAAAEAERVGQLKYIQDMLSKQKFERLKRLMITDMQLPDTVKLSFDAEWSDIRVETVTEVKEEITMIKSMLAGHWVELSDLYKHYSGSSDVGRTDEMSLVELSHCFMKMPGPEPFINMATDRKPLLNIFRRVNEGREASNDINSLTRFEFVECLIHWANHKFGTTRNETPLSTAVARMLVENIKPAADLLRTGEIRTLLLSKDMANFFSKALPRLRKVFLYYCRTDRAADDNGHTMSLREFAQLLVDAGIYERDRLRRRGGDITMKQVRQAFSGVQNETNSRHLDEEVHQHSRSYAQLSPGKGQGPADNYAGFTAHSASTAMGILPAIGPPRASRLHMPSAPSAADLLRPTTADALSLEHPGEGPPTILHNSSFAMLPTFQHVKQAQTDAQTSEKLVAMQAELERNKLEADSTNELVLNEMVEALSRLATQKRFREKLTLHQRVKAIIRMVCKLDAMMVGRHTPLPADSPGVNSPLVPMSDDANSSSMNVKAPKAHRRSSTKGSKGRRRSSARKLATIKDD